MHHLGPSTPPLVGREREGRAIADLLAPPGSRGQALNVLGVAGIGKSRLLATALTLARERGWVVLSARATPSEAPLKFAGLHQLLRPVLDHLDDLPGPQQDAISAAFGLSDRAAPDAFFVALATLGVLGEAAADAPVLAIVEDAQWLDRATCDVLTFVARRLDADPVVLLTAIRSGLPTPLATAGIPELVLDGLDPTASALLLANHGGDLSPAVRTRILDEAEGNPLALIELAAAARQAHLDDLASVPPWLPLGDRLQELFARQLGPLPLRTRHVLLLSALDAEVTIVDLVAASRKLHGTADVDDIVPAVAAGLVEVDEDGLRFRHPLVRSAVYRASTSAQRHQAHAALAEVFAADPAHAIWHRAAATRGRDDELAGEFADLARDAQQRGDVDLAVAARERAADLAGGPAQRAHHLLLAAELVCELGRTDTLRRLLGLIVEPVLDVGDRARSAWLHELASPGLPSRTARAELIATADRAHRAGHRQLAVRVLWVLAMKCWWDDVDAQEWLPVRAALDRIGGDGSTPRLLAVRAYAAPMTLGSHVAEAIAAAPVHADDEVGELWMLGNAASVVGAFDVASGNLGRAATMLRAQGRLGHLARVLTLSAWSDTHIGRWEPARLAAEEAGRLAEETGQPVWRAAATVASAYLAARRGEVDLAESLAASAERQAQPTGARFILATVQFVRGVAMLADGNHDAAYVRLRRLFDPTEPAHHPPTTFAAVADLVEAARHGGNLDDAAAVIAMHPGLQAPTAGPWIRVAMACVRPLLAPDAVADAAFLAALGGETMGWPFDHARLQLAYGQWLRRQRRTAESRRPLRAARDTFDELGAEPWGQRARRELRASGEASGPRAQRRRDQLTPQELQVALLAAEGHSNREIAQQLFLSHRTVGSHLYRVFPKLGVTSRGQLHVALDDAVPRDRAEPSWR